jgi:hypothetical protein
MGRSDLYIVSDQTNQSALPLVNDSLSRLADACRADPCSLERLESGSLRVRLVCFGPDKCSTDDCNPLSANPLPVVSPTGGVGLLSDGLRRVLELRLSSDAKLPDVLIFANSRSFEGVDRWLHSLSQFEWGWMSIYLLDEGAESDAKALLDCLYREIHSITGNGRVISANEFRRLSGELRSTMDLGWFAESPLTTPVVPPKGSVWVARNGVQIANGITPEAVLFLKNQDLFKPTDHYWTHGMAAWGVLADHR